MAAFPKLRLQFPTLHVRKTREGKPELTSGKQNWERAKRDRESTTKGSE